jgi:hypothetical protein
MRIEPVNTRSQSLLEMTQAQLDAVEMQDSGGTHHEAADGVNVKRGRLAVLEVPGQSGQRLRGRPHRLTDAVTETVCGALKEGAYAEEAATLAGIGRSTYYMWLSRGRVARSRREEDLPVSVTDEAFLDFLDSVERASIAPEIEALRIIHRAAEGGSWRAAAWFLERRYPHKWGPGRKEDLDGIGLLGEGSRTPVVTVEDLERRVTQILGRAPVTKSEVTVVE